jgi:SPP1 family predicted phage head-tail adaptor
MTKLSRTFNRKIQLWETVKVSDGFGGSTIQQNYVSDIWANVREVVNINFDVIGSSQNRIEKRITVRKSDLNTNINFFVVGGKGYQINDIQSNYKENQFICFCEATNFEPVVGTPATVLIINGQVLTLGNNTVLTI